MGDGDGDGDGGCTLTPSAPRSPQWQVQFDCFPVESGRQVLVSLRTVPDQGLAISRSHLVTAEPPGEAGKEWGVPGWGLAPADPPLAPYLCPPPPGPAFTHAWVPEARTIEVAVPEGPALMVRLCHQLALECEELPRPFHRQVIAGGLGGARSLGGPHAPGQLVPLPYPQVLVPGGHRVSLPYEFLVPCLCIEVCHCPVGSWGLSACPCSEGTRVAGTRHPLTALLPSPGLLPAA